MKSTDDIKLREYYLFSYLKSIVKTDYGDRVEKWYNTLDEKDKLEFLDDCMNNHIYVEEPPMYGNTSLYDIEEVYDRFGFKPLKCYVEKFGKLKPMMRKVVVGDVYFLKLKHHPKSKTSTRSTGFLDSKDQPTKTSTIKQNRSILPTTPLRFGDQETLNLLMNNNPDALVKLNMVYASSPIARRDISQIYTHGIVDNIEVNSEAKNRNVEILNVRLKTLGMGLEFNYNKDKE